MEDLRRPSHDRGQLLIVGAIALAILLIGIALALNTAVVGEIHVAQTGASLQEERVAIGYEESAAQGVSGLMRAINVENDSYEALERELDGAIESWKTASGSATIRDGAVTNTALRTVRFESRVIQNETRSFTDASGNTEWTVVENASNVRAFEMNVTDEALATTSDCSGSGACFELSVTGDAGGLWQLFVSDVNGSVTTTVISPSAGTEECQTNETPVGINVSAGTVDLGGSECEFTSFVEDGGVDGPYTLEYANAANVTGAYELTVDGKIVEGTIEDDERYGTGGSPRIEAALVAAQLDVRYRSAAVRYETTIWVSAGETDG